MMVHADAAHFHVISVIDRTCGQNHGALFRAVFRALTLTLTPIGGTSRRRVGALFRRACQDVRNNEVGGQNKRPHRASFSWRRIEP